MSSTVITLPFFLAIITRKNKHIHSSDGLDIIGEEIKDKATTQHSLVADQDKPRYSESTEIFVSQDE
jgi:hypothetical protein